MSVEQQQHAFIAIYVTMHTFRFVLLQVHIQSIVQFNFGTSFRVGISTSAMSGVADVTVAVFLMFPPIAIAKVGLVRSTVLAIRLVDGLLRQRQNIVRCFKSTT
jgi:hypothetical protein